MNSLTIKAPAKVNLFLKVLNKRPDGYHNIFTLFERIGICDTITLKKTPRGISLSSDRPITGRVKDNIAYKAAALVIKSRRIRGGVDIRIKKRIPIAAGLGGGSSDAAAVLAGMDRLFGLKYTKSGLMRLGRKLGADVGFFLTDKPFALATGRGDSVYDAGKKPFLWHLVVFPGPVKASTEDVYHYFDVYGAGSKDLTSGRGNDKMALHLRQAMDIGALEAMLWNNLESAVVAKKKVIGTIIRRLASSLGKKVVLSGSGPSVFCLYATRKEARSAKARVLDRIPAGTRSALRIFTAGTYIDKIPGV